MRAAMAGNERQWDDATQALLPVHLVPALLGSPTTLAAEPASGIMRPTNLNVNPASRPIVH